MRKLASIQKIWKIEPIEGADRIELAHVLGWQCVVNKGQFREMEDAVYFEVDSFLPVRDEFEFMRSSSFRKNDIMGEGFKLRTMKFRGQISQGLLLPVGTFSELNDNIPEGGWKVGDNVTELLKVKQWEIEERAATGGTIIGELPMDIPHTDETRIQAMPKLLKEFSGLEYYISTKLDGSSHSIGIDENGFHAAGHNYEYKDDGKSGFYNMINDKGIKDRVISYADRHGIKLLTIQGEFCAPGIQKNPLRLLKPEWFVFTVRIEGKRVGLDKMTEVCKELDIPMVPIEERGMDLPSVYPDVDSLLKRADGNYATGGRKEGIVIRPVEPVFSTLISGSLSMKVVSNKYLLKNEG